MSEPLFITITCCDSDGRLKLFALDAVGDVWEYSEADSTWYLLGDKRER
jgi:hypothetical protein